MSQLENCRIRKSSGTNPNQYEDNSSKNFSPNFYNPFEVKHRRRTSRTQFKILEKAFSSNPKPNSKIRQGLAESLSMTPRGVQVWFQNRRAKEKQMGNHVKTEASHPPKQQQQQQQHLNHAPVTLSASNMFHSRSQSSSSSSTNKPWISDNSTVNDEEEEELATIKTPPNNQSSQIPLEGDSEWWFSHAGNMVPFIHHQTTAEIKADPVTMATAAGMSSADSAVNLNAWPATSTYFNQPFLPTTDIHTMTSHDCTMRSVPNNSNVVDWIQSTQVMNDNLILDDLLDGSSSKNFNMSHKRYSYPLSMPLQQDETYWTGQQIMRRLSEPSQEASELELMDPYNNTNYSAMIM
ncbi:unnamed protein product [Mucor fragilis]